MIKGLYRIYFPLQALVFAVRFLHYCVFGNSPYTFAVAGAHKFLPERRDSVLTEVAASDRFDYLVVVNNDLAGDEALVIEIKAPVVLILLKVVGIEKHRLTEQGIFKYQR